MSGPFRPKKVQELLRREISNILINDIKDPRAYFVTITRVSLTKDLRFARVYFSIRQTDNKKIVIEGLHSAKGFVKRLVGMRLKLKFVPEIDFIYDESLENVQKVYDILDELKRKERQEDVD